MEEERKEERKKTGIFVNFTCKKYWYWQLIILFVFLIGFGIIAYFLLGSQAYKLVRVPGYSELSSNTFGRGGNIAQKLVNFFSSEENIEVEKRAKAGFSFEDSSVAMVSGNNNSPEEIKENSSNDVLPYKSSQNSSALYSKNEYNRLSSALQHGFSNDSRSMTSRLHGFGEENKTLASVVKNREENMKTFIRSSGKISALDSLKGAWRASIYGARLTSQDSAKTWTAKVFEATPDDEYALEYNEEMKSQLDRLNPNAIPDFLKNQNIDLDPIKSLKDSQVPDFKKEKDEEATEEALKEDKKYQEEKAKWEMMQSMLNPLFGGFNFAGGNPPDNSRGPEETPETPANLDKAAPSQPESSSYWVDEEGNIYQSNDFGNNPPWGQCIHQCGFNLPSCPNAECCEMAATCYV